MKNLKKLTGIVLCMVLVLSMLAVGVATAAAGAEEDGPQTPYALHFASKNANEQLFWYNFAEDAELPVLKTGDVYRFSYYYAVPEGSQFPNNHGSGGAAYVSFKIPDGSGDFWLKLEDFTSTDTSGSAWNYEEYTWTVPEKRDGKPIQRLQVNLSKTFDGDYLKLTDIRLCKVTDGVAGENLLGNINKDAKFSSGGVGSWARSGWRSDNASDTSWFADDSDYTFKIEAVNKDDFKRPVTLCTVKDSEGNLLTTVNAGTALDLSTLTTPKKNGYRFTGYFTDADCKTPFADGTVINENTVLYYGWEEQVPGGPEGEYALKIVNNGTLKGTKQLAYGYSSPGLFTGDKLRFSFYYKSDDENSTFPDFSDRKTPIYFSWRMKTKEGNDTFVGLDLFDVTTVDKGWYRLQYDVTIPEARSGMNLGMFNINFQADTGKQETIYLAGFRLCRVIDGEEQENLLHYLNEDGAFDYPGGGRAWFIYNSNLNNDKTEYTVADNSWTFSIVPLDYESFKRPDRSYDLTLNNATTADGKTSYKFGETVTVKADAAPKGQAFDYWTVGGTTAAELGIAAGDEEITFEMPDRNITLTANYTEAEVDDSSDNSDDSSDNSDSSKDNSDSSVDGDNSNSSNADNPDTGDAFSPALWCAIVCCAALTAGLTIRKKAQAK